VFRGVHPPSATGSSLPKVAPTYFLPFPVLSFTFPSSFFSLLPPNPVRGSGGEHCKLPLSQRDPGRKRILRIPGSGNASHSNIFCCLCAMQVTGVLICQVKKKSPPPRLTSFKLFFTGSIISVVGVEAPGCVGIRHAIREQFMHVLRRESEKYTAKFFLS